ncbi:MAG: hypothetical protein R2820_10630 [Cyclobacteriaceae bacterium]|nr:hypothetical protein [Cyclobacteriaceae bacterium]
MKVIGILFLSFIAIPLFAQEEEPKKLALKGYLKDMSTFNYFDDNLWYDNLVHNRLNLAWYANPHFNAYLEVRNRIFMGDQVRNVPGYAMQVDTNNDYFDLSVQHEAGKSTIFQSMIDRAYVEWYNDKWEVRAGRQRINWGVNLVWNPNDLFNVYSFFDFDYEERPGSDAIRIKRYTGFASSVELAATLNDDFDKTVMAGMWKVNKWGYDFQFLAGKAREDVTLGMGWAGNIKKAGFKGELTWFEPYRDNGSVQALLASISVDYSFESSLYLNGSLLFNSDGSDTQFLNSAGFGNSGQLTVRNLSPFKYSTFFQTSYKFHPLITGGLAIIYYPSSRNALFLNPNATFSLKPNLDLDLIGQIYYDKLLDDYRALAKLGYVRLKWSF